MAMRWGSIAGVALVAGCRPATNAPPLPPATARPVTIRTDTKGLRNIITVPRRPTVTVWRHTQIGDGEMGPSDSQLLAVIQYPSTDADAIEKSSKRKASGTGEVAVESWFPAALRQKAMRAPNGQLVIRGSKLEAGTFARLSLHNGFGLRVPNTPYIIVSLFTT